MGPAEDGLLSPLSERDLSTLPISLLQAELHRRQQQTDGSEPYQKPACGSRGKIESYNTPIHVFALVLILVLSTVACAFPIIARRFPKLPFPHRFLFISRHFGTGVLIATAFVHLLPTAFVSLTDPCLPSFWNEGYPPMAGFIAMLAVFAVVSIEMFFASRGAGHTHTSDFDGNPGQAGGYTDEARQPRGPGLRARADSFRRFRATNGSSDDVALRALADRDAWKSSTSLSGERDQHSPSYCNDDNEDLDSPFTELEAPDGNDESAPLHSGGSPLGPNHPRKHSSSHRHGDTGDLEEGLTTESAAAQKQFLQCLLLEAGILFHSIFIGMALSVTTGPAFIVFLIAISFHQTFEGLALGSRIGALIPALFKPTSPKPWLMALAYGTTTPIGQAIGLVLHNMYDPASATGLITVGITNSISSGLLLFAGLVELLAEDFLSEDSYKTLTGRRRMEAWLSVGAGGLLMALVGAWA